MATDLIRVLLADDHTVVRAGLKAVDTRIKPEHHGLGEKPVPKETEQSLRERYDRLTNRERDVLRMVGQGYSAPEIGAELGISSKTVDTYKQRIQEKLDLSHRSHYVQFALKLGLLARD